MLRFLSCIAFISLIAIVPAMADKRVALVIGNSVYSNAPRLKNPEEDAAAISAALTRIGFDVTPETDLSLPQMNKALRKFVRKSRDADMAVIYYAGHGIEVDKKNWLVPTDAELATDADVEFETVSLDQLNRAVSGAKTLRLVIIDACRDNPFTSQMKTSGATRSMSRGLARVEDPGPGTLVVFAAAAGQVAEDGNGTNSPFATALLNNLEQPGLEVSFMFRKVRDQVMELTSNRQKPFTYGSLPGREIYLQEGDAPESPARPATPLPQDQVEPSQATLELAYWNAIKDSDDTTMFEEFLKRFSGGTFETIARSKLMKLQNASLAPTPTPRPKLDAGLIALKKLCRDISYCFSLRYNDDCDLDCAQKTAERLSRAMKKDVHVAGKRFGGLGPAGCIGYREDIGATREMAESVLKLLGGHYYVGNCTNDGSAINIRSISLQ